MDLEFLFFEDCPEHLAWHNDLCRSLGLNDSHDNHDRDHDNDHDDHDRDHNNDHDDHNRNYSNGDDIHDHIHNHSTENCDAFVSDHALWQEYLRHMSLSQTDYRFRALDTNIDFVARLMQLEQFLKNVMNVFEKDFCEWTLNSDLLMHFYPLLAPLALDLNWIICRYRQNCHDYEQTLNLGLNEEPFLDDDLPSLS